VSEMCGDLFREMCRDAPPPSGGARAEVCHGRGVPWSKCSMCLVPATTWGTALRSPLQEVCRSLPEGAPSRGASCPMCGPRVPSGGAS